jgi:hypothetical protein
VRIYAIINSERPSRPPIFFSHPHLNQIYWPETYYATQERGVVRGKAKQAYSCHGLWQNKNNSLGLKNQDEQFGKNPQLLKKSASRRKPVIPLTLTGIFSIIFGPSLGGLVPKSA